MNKICKQCGNEFEPLRKDSKCCSKECYKIYWKLNKSEICINCGKAIDKTYKSGHRKSIKYCSHSCFCEHRKSKRDAFYSVETLCKCGCGGIILNPDDHYRYRKFLPEHRNANGTHPRLGYKEDEEHLEKRIDAVKKYFRKKKPTCLEAQLHNYLKSIKIKHIMQERIGRFIPDAFVSKLNLCIFADGKYWHNLPKNHERDLRANKYLEERGYKVIRLSTVDRGYILDLEPLKQFLNN